MECIWLKSYPEGVPAEVDVDAFSSIVDMFEKSVTEFADRPAYIHMGATLTYAEVDRLSRDFAAFLREDLKLPRGARVALMMPNVLQYPIALFGALRGGYVVVIKPFIIISTFRRHNAATVFDRTNGFFLDRFVVAASTNEPCS